MQILEHIHVNVASIEATRQFLKVAVPEYCRRGGGIDPVYGEWLHVGTDLNYIALTQTADTTPIEGLRHIGLVVDDLDGLMARLSDAGFNPSDSNALDVHPHRRRVYYCDRNGLHWEFVQYLSADTAERNDYSL